MFRLLGFLIGSAASVAAILLITGMPKFHLEDPVIDQKRFDEAVEKLMARKLEVDQAAEEPGNEVVQAVESTEDNSALPETDAIAQAENSEPAEEQAPINTFEDTVPAAMDFSFQAPGVDAGALTEMQWYSFWNPFRSNIAANGFVSRLEKVTGLDYRVVKVKTGVYEVAFAYNDDSERRTKLSQISAATGLDLSN